MKFTKIFFVILSIFALSGCSSKNVNKTTNNVDDNTNKPAISSNIIKTDSNTSNNTTTSKETSLNEIFKGNENLKCIFSSTNADNSKQEVTYYIDSSKKRFRVQSDIEFETNPGQKSHIYAILSDGYIYSWIDTNGQMNVGTKFKIGDSSNKDIIDFNEKVKLNCEKWNIDSSYFNLPTNINFQDYSTIAK